MEGHSFHSRVSIRDPGHTPRSQQALKSWHESFDGYQGQYNPLYDDVSKNLEQTPFTTTEVTLPYGQVLPFKILDPTSKVPQASSNQRIGPQGTDYDWSSRQSRSPTPSVSSRASSSGESLPPAVKIVSRPWGSPRIEPTQQGVVLRESHRSTEYPEHLHNSSSRINELAYWDQ